jgi:hypothetical protein
MAKVSKLYEDGSLYQGRMINNHRNGNGTFRFKMYDLPCTYIGGWKDDCYHGYADYTYWTKFNDKILKVHYLGEMRNGEANGQGTLTWIDDNIQVVGHWNDSNCLHGKIITKTTSYFGDIGENRYPYGFGKLRIFAVETEDGIKKDETMIEGDFL